MKTLLPVELASEDRRADKPLAVYVYLISGQYTCEFQSPDYRYPAELRKDGRAVNVEIPSMFVGTLDEAEAWLTDRLLTRLIERGDIKVSESMCGTAYYEWAE